MQSCTIGAIATRPSNDGGGYYFISLSTGRRINRRSWTPMPMLSEVVAQVHCLARQAKAKKTITFTNTRDEDLDVLYAAIEHEEDDVDLVQADYKLVGVDGGFSCVACHGVKNRDPLQVFEAQGVNFARAGARLHPDYYLRWMLDPLRVDSQSRMPDYFDEDARSVLVDVLEGDAKKQIEAIRQYLRQGNQMKIPTMQ